MPLSDDQIARYSRQIVLPDLGGRGQETLLASSVAIVGTAELGRTAAAYLSAAGVGRLTLLAGAVECAAVTAALLGDLADLNPDVSLDALAISDPLVDAAWAAGYDVVVDTTGESETIARINGIVLAARRPLVVGAAGAARGWLSVFAGGWLDGSCAGCWPEEPRDSCGGPLASSVAGVIGSLIALEVLRLRLDLAPSASGLGWLYDADTMRLDSRILPKNPGCPACAHAPRTEAGSICRCGPRSK